MLNLSKKLMQTRFSVICVNDKDKPDGIPNSKWIKHHEIYTVIKIVFPHLQPGTMGFKLEELNIDDCLPYQYFNAKRFALILPLSDRQWAEEVLDDILDQAIEEERLQNLQ